MADTKISGLPASTVPLAGTEVLPIVQSSTTKQVSIANVTAGRDVSALTLGISGSTSTTPVLGFNAANAPLVMGATISGSYLQVMAQNKSGTAGASTNYVLSNDLGTDSTYYGEFGINSSVFSASTPADYFSINNGIYYSGHDGDVSLGSGNGFKTYFAWGTTGQSAHVINATGALGFSTNLGTTPALSGTTGFGTSGQVLVTGGSAAAPAWSGSLLLPATGNVLINQTYDQATGKLQLKGNSTFTGIVTSSTLNLQGGNNLLTYSNTFTSWAKTAVTVTATATIAPDGTNTASSIIATAVSGVHRCLSNGFTPLAMSYTISFNAKANGYTLVALTDSTNGFLGASFDLSSVTSSNLGGGAIQTTSIISIGNGWYKCNATFLGANVLVSANIMGYPSTGATATKFDVSYTGDGTSGIYVNNAQVEAGTQASAYTPTTTAAVTTTNDLNMPSGSLAQSKPIATLAAAPTVASGATIALTTLISFVSGTTTINTITAPAPLSTSGGQLTLIPTGLFLTSVTGNIALASTAVVNKALIMTYDSTTAKWYPSY